MLQRLRISNIVLAENLDLEFYPGFTVLTGETGAGKSILIDSLSLSLGMPARQDMIRTGEKKAFVEAHFRAGDSARLKSLVLEQELEDESGLLVLSREFQKDRGSSSRINGRTVSAAILKNAAQCVVDIHGQHEHQSLFHAESHIEYLDAYAGNKAQTLKRLVSDLHAQRLSLEKELLELTEKERDRVRRLDMARHELSEISAARLEPGEDEELAQRIYLHQHQEKLNASVGEAYHALYDEAHSALLKGSRHIDAVTDIDKRLTGVKEFLDSALAHLEEAVNTLREYRGSLEFDAAAFEKDMERHEVLRNLKRKYGAALDDVLNTMKSLEKEIEQLSALDARKDVLEKKTLETRKQLHERAGELSAMRKKASAQLQKVLQKELKDLGIPEARFTIQISPLSDAGPSGMDRVEFLFSANPGEDVKPLTRIASGGEISRVMLALKTALSKQDPVPVLVFDEIDAGIGGETAVKVARKLSALARTHQVICITHLAIIASYADHHLCVQKLTKNGKTVIAADALTGEKRHSEIARMLRGEGKSATTIKDAQELLQGAKKEKAGAGKK